MCSRVRSPSFVSSGSDDETHVAARVEASSFILFPRLLGLKDGCRSRPVLCCTYQNSRFGANERKSEWHFLPLQLFNKVAGVYGLIAVLTGAGGSAAQLSLYIYSTIALVALAWGLNAVNRVSLSSARPPSRSLHPETLQEDARSTFYFAHLFFADHILSTSWTIFFAVVWWLYNPHDGRRVSNSAAQDKIIDNYLGETEQVSEEERARLALQLWRKEKGVAITIIVLGWLIKVRGSDVD